MAVVASEKIAEALHTQEWADDYLHFSRTCTRSRIFGDSRAVGGSNLRHYCSFTRASRAKLSDHPEVQVPSGRDLASLHNGRGLLDSTCSWQRSLPMDRGDRPDTDTHRSVVDKCVGDASAWSGTPDPDKHCNGSRRGHRSFPSNAVTCIRR